MSLSLPEFRIEFGERLRAERNRLGFTQPELAQIAAVQKQAQMKYENGSRSPAAEYLAAVSSAGVDVAFVLTGEPAQFTSDEAELVRRYRCATAQLQQAALAVLSALPPAESPQISTVNVGDNFGQLNTGSVKQRNVTFNVKPEKKGSRK